MEAMHPRTRGIFVLFGACFCVTLNLFFIARLGEWYPFLFPFAGAMVPVGVVLVVTGRMPRAKPAAWTMLVGMAVGIVGGLTANVLVGGSLF